MNQSVIDTVYTLARFGLAKVAKDTRNGPAVVAQHADALEQWRAEMERQLTEPQTTEAKP